MEYHTPKNTHPADEIYAVLSKDDGGEGIVSIMTGAGSMPLVVIDNRILDKAKPYIQHIAKEKGCELYIVKYTKTEILEVIKP
jgi:DUF1009 family protein